MSVRNRQLLDQLLEPDFSESELESEIDYPESDGQPMAETDRHIQTIVDLRSMLRDFFRADDLVYVGSNLLLYYVEDDPDKCIAPDVFVARGVGKHERRIYKLWEEQHPPNVVIEVSSRKTKKDDLNWKKQLYAWFGVREYFIFDPEYKLKPPLRAYRLRGGQFVEEAVIGGRVLSHELKLELVNSGKNLRLFDPTANAYLLSPDEAAAARREAESARQEAEAARREAEAAQHAEIEARLRVEAELERLRAELAALKRKPGKKSGK